MTKRKDSNLTPASHWRRQHEEGIEVELPSGAVVRMRPSVDVRVLIATGRIPDGLTRVALEGINLDTRNEQALEQALKRAQETYRQMDAVYRVVCEEAWLHPRIVDNPSGEDEIAFEWLTFEDKEYTWTLIQQPVSEWRRFLSRWRASVEPVPNGTAEPPEAERPVED